MPKGKRVRINRKKPGKDNSGQKKEYKGVIRIYSDPGGLLTLV